MDQLQISTGPFASGTVVHADGEIDLTTCGGLRDQLGRVQLEDGDIVVDLTRVEFIDSTGLSVLVDGARSARARGRAFGVVADGHLRELLRVTGLDTVMDVHRRLADAGCPDPGKGDGEGAPASPEASAGTPSSGAVSSGQRTRP